MRWTTHRSDPIPRRSDPVGCAGRLESSRRLSFTQGGYIMTSTTVCFSRRRLQQMVELRRNQFWLTLSLLSSLLLLAAGPRAAMACARADGSGAGSQNVASGSTGDGSVRCSMGGEGDCCCGSSLSAGHPGEPSASGAAVLAGLPAACDCGMGSSSPTDPATTAPETRLVGFNPAAPAPAFNHSSSAVVCAVLRPVGNHGVPTDPLLNRGAGRAPPTA